MTLQPKAISLFAGAGGCSLGFSQAGFNIVYATDADRRAMETYRANFPNTRADCQDINDLDFSVLLEELGLREGETDIVIGGPPCQGFSTAGPRFWDDPRNHLLKQYVRALDTIRPKWFLMENVEGLLTSNNGEYVARAVQAFTELGYLVRLEKVYAQEHGIPQRRKRVIIMGNRLGIEFGFPQPVTPVHGKIFRKSSVTLADALSGLLQTAPDHEMPALDGLQLDRIRRLGPGQTMKDLPEHLQHASFKRRAARRVSDGMPSEKRGGAPSGLKRLRADEPCLTITGAAIREFVHPTEDRCLTIRECARVQTFPDDFVFCGSSSDRIRQIGNAIPPMLARTFAEHIDSIGFEDAGHDGRGTLLGFSLTKSEGLSPALQHTAQLLNTQLPKHSHQLSIFEDAC